MDKKIELVDFSKIYIGLYSEFTNDRESCLLDCEFILIEKIDDIINEYMGNYSVYLDIYCNYYLSVFENGAVLKDYDEIDKLVNTYLSNIVTLEEICREYLNFINNEQELDKKSFEFFKAVRNYVDMYDKSIMTNEKFYIDKEELMKYEENFSTLCERFYGKNQLLLEHNNYEKKKELNIKYLIN